MPKKQAKIVNSILMPHLDIVYEDSKLLVVNKPAGLVVNKADSVDDLTLQDLLARYFNLKENDLGIGNRAGIVHRLDRETSGLLIVAKTEKAFTNLQKQFKERLVEKKYLGLCHGKLEKAGTIKSKVIRNPKKLGKFTTIDQSEEEGKEAETNYQTIGFFRIPNAKVEELAASLFPKSTDYYRQFAYLSYVAIFPKSGRTHQIRVHLKSLQRPIVSDKLYLGKRLFKFDIKWCPRLFLHATSISFNHPTNHKRISLSVDLPNDLTKALNYLEEVN